MIDMHSYHRVHTVQYSRAVQQYVLPSIAVKSTPTPKSHRNERQGNGPRRRRGGGVGLKCSGRHSVEVVDSPIAFDGVGQTAERAAGGRCGSVGMAVEGGRRVEWVDDGAWWRWWMFLCRAARGPWMS